MIKYLKHIKDCILSGLFLSVILFTSVSVFDKTLSDNYERASQVSMISEGFGDHTSAVLTNAFLNDLDLHLFSNDRIDLQTRLTNKYILLNTNIEIITAYKNSCKARLDIKPILYSSSQNLMSDYYQREEHPSIS